MKISFIIMLNSTVYIWLPVRNVLNWAHSGPWSKDGVKETTGISGKTSEGVHVHHTHVPKSLTCCQVGEDLEEEHDIFTKNFLMRDSFMSMCLAVTKVKNCFIWQQTRNIFFKIKLKMFWIYKTCCWRGIQVFHKPGRLNTELLQT